MPKITKSDEKLSEIYEKRVAPFSGQCNLPGSIGTCVNYGRIFIDFFTANLLQSEKVK